MGFTHQNLRLLKKTFGLESSERDGLQVRLKISRLDPDFQTLSTTLLCRSICDERACVINPIHISQDAGDHRVRTLVIELKNTIHISQMHEITESGPLLSNYRIQSLFLRMHEIRESGPKLSNYRIVTEDKKVSP